MDDETLFKLKIVIEMEQKALSEEEIDLRIDGYYTELKNREKAANNSTSTKSLRIKKASSVATKERDVMETKGINVKDVDTDTLLERLSALLDVKESMNKYRVTLNKINEEMASSTELPSNEPIFDFEQKAEEEVESTSDEKEIKESKINSSQNHEIDKVLDADILEGIDNKENEEDFLLETILEENNSLDMAINLDEKEEVEQVQNGILVKVEKNINKHIENEPIRNDANSSAIEENLSRLILVEGSDSGGIN
jgi:hypothetical protein